MYAQNLDSPFLKRGAPKLCISDGFATTARLKCEYLWNETERQRKKIFNYEESLHESPKFDELDPLTANSQHK